MTQEILVQLQNINYAYSQNKQSVLKDFSLEIKAGEKLFLYGPSGSGKTTLLEILAGVLKPTSGDYFFKNINVGAKTETERDHFRGTHIGYIFQSFNLLPYLNVLENVTLPALLYPERGGFANDHAAHDQAIDLLKKLGMESILNQSSNALSVGQQQRVAVARALMGNPQLILADEPTSSLDYDHREKFLKLLFELCQERKSTLLFVSHDRSIEKLFDRSVALGELQ